MKLSAEQRQQVADWVAGGANLSEVQRRLESEFSLRMTYMDVRFLIDDLEITLPDKPASQPTKDVSSQSGTGASSAESGELLEADGSPVGPGSGSAGSVSVTIDKVTRPGAVASGTVKFSDGTNAKWVLDQMGRLGLDGVSPDYRPSEQDMMAFQRELSEQARKMGL